MTSLLLRQPNFRWLWLGQTFLFCGVQFWFVAITWLMLQRPGSGSSLALVLMAAALPRGLLMLPGGALSDHHPPRTLAVRAAWALALCTAVLTLLAQRNALDPGPVATLAALFGTAEACGYPAAMALLLLAAGCFFRLRPRPVPWLREAAGGLLGDICESLGFAWRHRAIRTGLGLIAMINLAVLGPVVIGVVELVTLRFGGGAATFGSLQAAYGVAALVGLATAWLQRETPGPLQGRVMALAMVAAVAFDPLSQALAGVLLDVPLTALFLKGGGTLLLTALLVLRPCGRPPLTASKERNRRHPPSSRAAILQQRER